ncbi:MULTISPECIES: cysteine desulfurase [Leuconostoc]|uniref:cysteine desulfurase n=1 Tax=Leuconostoc TaxID=1243 RepID=UPI00090AE589|nr:MULTISPECIES: cysteine desulfurase [Leuconostoc]API72951.1 cysteine sulfinate desulfinase [Leuconostoc suionicum]MBE4726798.1 cysteine desulfurase [Leuconostoc suionicum]MCT4402825.1 cysteine desulfurase [Leuconostoc suionicum]MDI6523174.1 cysteine desulfurase [Leuconostoc suionicum]MDI6544453.1 cysteine desulfurase [Leuconostoc suionicum]
MKMIKTDFPILNQKINGQQMIYFDNAATSQKPQFVIDSLVDYYQNDNANVHRGIYELSERATNAYEQARDKVQNFIHAKKREEVLFTRGTTESLNWLASTYGAENIKQGDEILISYMEHHSNIVPWQQLAQRVGANLKYINLKADGTLDLADAEEKMSDRTKIVSVTHASNVLGVVNPIKELAQMAHQHGAIMIADGAQSAPHMVIDVQDMNVDFFAFSGHKMLGPTGIGVLYGKYDVLNKMNPAQFGGEMIELVDLHEATFQPLPWRFEAGTPNIAGAIGLGAAVDYLTNIGMTEVEAYEQSLVSYALPKIKKIPGVTVYGPQDSEHHSGVIAFNLDSVHAHDLATALDQEGIEVRAGHHCTQPLMRYLGIAATVRVSLYIYNTREEIDHFIDIIGKIKEYFNREFA